MTPRSASLGMYDRPEVQGANDRLWQAIACQLTDAGIAGVPAALDRSRPLPALWDDPGLLLGHICGYPLVTAWRGRLRYVATPRYRAPGCEGSDHRSRIVVRVDHPATALSELRGQRAAISERTSNTGMNLLRAAVAPLADGRPFFASVTETGSHAASAALIAAGGADVAAIDTVTAAHLERYEPALAHRLRTIGWTEATPGLPLVTSRSTSRAGIAALRRALLIAAADPELEPALGALLIEGFDILHPSRYRAVARLERQAQRSGYPIVA